MGELGTSIVMSIKNFFASQTKRRLFENFVFLSFLQVANYIFPLITLPYLVRVLGLEKFGLIAFAQAFISYFQILTDYGFNLSATREISIHRENKEKVSEIFSAVMIIKFFLLLVSLIIMTAIVFSFNKFRQEKLIYFLTFGMVLGQTLFPIWLFQGLEKMKYITFLNILAKLIFTLAIFILIKNTSDYIYAPLLNSLGYIIAGLAALWIIIKDFDVKFNIPIFEKLNFYLKDGWIFFKTNAFISAYRGTNVFILGLITNNTITGYYSIAETILKGVQTIQSPLGQALYPFFCSKYVKDEANFKTYHFKYLKLIISIYIILALLLILFSGFITKIITGFNIYQISLNIKVLSAVVFIGGMNYYFGILGLIPLKLEENFVKYVFIAGFSNIFLCTVLSYLLKDLGACVSLVCCELTLLFLIINKIKIKYFNENSKINFAR